MVSKAEGEMRIVGEEFGEREWGGRGVCGGDMVDESLGVMMVGRTYRPITYDGLHAYLWGIVNCFFGELGNAVGESRGSLTAVVDVCCKRLKKLK